MTSTSARPQGLLPRTDTDAWWRDAVIYQIYPRSFADANGDGIGDIQGIREHIDHLVALGVDAVWLSPFYPSPQVDAGYDVSDYFDLAPEYGSLQDLDALIAGVEAAVVDPGSREYAAPGGAEQIAPGAVGAIADVMGRGNAGRARIPGKHGGAPRRYAEVQVLVPDSPGELGRLFSDVGAAGVNVEDFSMEHSPGQSAGLAMVSVLPAAAAHLEAALDARGWRVVVG